MVFNRSKITIWKEYFLRFDEGKRESMTLQMQAQEQKIRRNTALGTILKESKDDVAALLKQLKDNQERIN